MGVGVKEASHVSFSSWHLPAPPPRPGSAVHRSTPPPGSGPGNQMQQVRKAQGSWGQASTRARSQPREGHADPHHANGRCRFPSQERCLAAAPERPRSSREMSPHSGPRARRQEKGERPEEEAVFALSQPTFTPQLSSVSPYTWSRAQGDREYTSPSALVPTLEHQSASPPQPPPPASTECQLWSGACAGWRRCKANRTGLLAGHVLAGKGQ